jgi:hypothetical protein
VYRATAYRLVNPKQPVEQHPLSAAISGTDLAC